MKPTEDGEFDNILHMPPRRIVHREPEELREIKYEEIKLSSTLKSKLESLRGSILICDSSTCITCSPRVAKMDILENQIKSELSAIYDLDKKLNELQAENAMLKIYIETNNPLGTVDKILRQSKIGVVE